MPAELLQFVAASQTGFCIGQFARLLPALAVVAVSQAPSPESNPDSPLPVRATVVHYTTVQADRSEVRVIKQCFCSRGHHSASASVLRGTSLSQPDTLPFTGAGLPNSWVQSTIRGCGHGGLYPKQVCHGRPGQTCISHQVLEDVQLSAWQMATGRTLSHG